MSYPSPASFTWNHHVLPTKKSGWSNDPISEFHMVKNQPWFFMAQKTDSWMGRLPTKRPGRSNPGGEGFFSKSRDSWCGGMSAGDRMPHKGCLNMSQYVVLMPGWWFGTWLLIFHHIGNFIIPIDFHIFQRGRYTTNQMMCLCCLQTQLEICMRYVYCQSLLA